VLSGTPVTLTAGRNRSRSPRTDPISMVGLIWFARLRRRNVVTRERVAGTALPVSRLVPLMPTILPVPRDNNTRGGTTAGFECSRPQKMNHL
jgi:hypothetical protein